MSIARFLAAILLPKGSILHSLEGLNGKEAAKEFALKDPEFIRQLYALASKNEVTFSVSDAREKINFFAYLLVTASEQDMLVTDLSFEKPKSFVAREALRVKTGRLRNLPALNDVIDVIALADKSFWPAFRDRNNAEMKEVIKLTHSTDFAAFAHEVFETVKTPTVPGFNTFPQ